MSLKAIRLIPGTKISRDLEAGNEKIWDYSELINAGVPEIGIPLAMNGLIVIDIDVPGESHKYDGRPWWRAFCEEHGIPRTFTICTRSGGYHFYFRIPPHINIALFRPPGQLALGVDVKYDGYVAAPPSQGYSVHPQGNPSIIDLPEAFLKEFEKVKNTSTTTTYEVGGVPVIHRSFSAEQVGWLRKHIPWIQTNVGLTRDEWRDGIFSLKAGAYNDSAILEELVVAWTRNRNYSVGDEVGAMSIADKADAFGDIGPGTIFSLIQGIFQREGYVSEGASISSVEILDRAGITYDFNKKGQIKFNDTESNTSAIISHFVPEKDLYFDVRKDLYIYKGKPSSDKEILSAIMPSIQKPLSGLGFENLRKPVLISGLEVTLYQRQVDPHKEWLKGIKWDGVERIETSLIKAFGLADTQYHRILGLNMWTVLAARGLRPGCKFDSVFVLEGNEGIRKSSFVKLIGRDYFYSARGKNILTDLDSLRQMHQAVTVEFPELKGLIDSDGETSKSFTAQEIDTIRGLWERKAMPMPRGFVLFGTTNEEEYLQRSMGDRRWWPIKIPPTLKHIDLDFVERNLEQFYAEGIQRYKDGYEYWHMPKNLLDPIIKTKQKDNDFIGYVQELSSKLGNQFTSLEMYSELAKLGVVGKTLTDPVGKRITGALTDLGYYKHTEGYKTVWMKNHFNLENLGDLI